MGCLSEREGRVDRHHRRARRHSGPRVVQSLHGALLDRHSVSLEPAYCPIEVGALLGTALRLRRQADIILRSQQHASSDERDQLFQAGVARQRVVAADHPGANDSEYRTRRDYIASLSKKFRETGKITDVDYTEEEQDIWRHVATRLEELHDKYASPFYLRAKKDLGITTERIPQLSEMNRRLKELTGYAAPRQLLHASKRLHIRRRAPRDLS